MPIVKHAAKVTFKEASSDFEVAGRTNNSKHIQFAQNQQRIEVAKLIANERQKLLIEKQSSKASRIKAQYASSSGKVRFVNYSPKFQNYGKEKILSHFREISSFKTDLELNSYLRSLSKLDFQIFVAKTVHDVEKKGSFDPVKYLNSRRLGNKKPNIQSYASRLEGEQLNIYVQKCLKECQKSSQFTKTRLEQRKLSQEIEQALHTDNLDDQKVKRRVENQLDPKMVINIDGVVYRGSPVKREALACDRSTFKDKLSKIFV